MATAAVSPAAEPKKKLQADSDGEEGGEINNGGDAASPPQKRGSKRVVKRIVRTVRRKKGSKQRAEDEEGDDAAGAAATAMASLPPIASGRSPAKQHSPANVVTQARQHQFRDDDRGAAGVKVDRRPHDIVPIEDDAALNKKLGRKRSLSPQHKARQHQFRDEDATLPPVVVKDSKFAATNGADAEKNKEKIAEYQKRIREKNAAATVANSSNNSTVQSDRNNSTMTNATATTTTPAKRKSETAGGDATATPSAITTTSTTNTPRRKTQTGGSPPSAPSPPQRKTSNVGALGRHAVSFRESGPGNTVVASGDDDNNATRLSKKGSSFGLGTSSMQVATSGSGGVDTSFPRQPRCNPADLDCPVRKILDMLFDKYAAPSHLGSVPGAEAGDVSFPVARLSVAFGKLWPGNALTDEMIRDCVDVLLQDRAAANAAAANMSASSAKAAFAESSTVSATNGVSLRNAVSGGSSSSVTASVALLPAPGLGVVDLPDNELSQREFNCLIRVLQTYNNWRHFLGEEISRLKVLDLDSYAKVSDRLQMENPAKLYMELTDKGMKELTLVRLARHVALSAKRRQSVSLALIAAASFKAKTREQAIAKEEEDRRAKLKNEAESFASAALPRQPKCQPDDLSLPTTRILKIVFHHYAQTAAEIEAGGHDAPFVAGSSINPGATRGNSSANLQIDLAAASAISNTGDAADATSSPLIGDMNTLVSFTATDRFFPLSKLPVAMSKIWPGHTVPSDIIDDATDAVIDDRTAPPLTIAGAAAAAAAAASGASSTNTAAYPPNAVDQRELNRILRTIANLNNWQPVLPETVGKVMSIEEFALVCDRLAKREKVEKPAKLFLELGRMGDVVTQAQLALYFTKKNKTLRFAGSAKKDADGDGETDSDAAEEDGAAGNNDG